jgi:hypothetical protein
LKFGVGEKVHCPLFMNNTTNKKTHNYTATYSPINRYIFIFIMSKMNHGLCGLLPYCSVCPNKTDGTQLFFAQKFFVVKVCGAKQYSITMTLTMPDLTRAIECQLTSATFNNILTFVKDQNPPQVCQGDDEVWRAYCSPQHPPPWSAVQGVGEIQKPLLGKWKHTACHHCFTGMVEDICL